MKMTNNYLLQVAMLLAIIACFSSCGGTEPQTIFEEQPETTVSARATNVYRSIIHNSLRNGEEVHLESIDSLSTDREDTKLYLANFENAGFMLFQVCFHTIKCRQVDQMLIGGY